jgi:hypothetical protein
MHGTGSVCMHESMRKDGTSWVLDETVKSLSARGLWDSVDSTTVEVYASLARPADREQPLGDFRPTRATRNNAATCRRR